jgi:hypothetical protein
MTEINPCGYSHLILDRVTKKTASSTNGVKTGYPHVED